jgi:arsenate reductase
MAEALANAWAGGRLAAASAGSRPVERVNPLAVAAVAELGIAMERAYPKHLDRFAAEAWDYVVTVCDEEGEACPVFPGPAVRIHWSIQDPAAVTGATEDQMRAFRTVRDTIGQHLRDLLSGIRIDA